MRTILILCFAVAAAPAFVSESIAGLWTATVFVNDTEIPFSIAFSGDGPNVRGWFFNGDHHENSTGGDFHNGKLVLNFATYASVLKATLKNGSLEGEYLQQGKALPFHADRTLRTEPNGQNAPDISGIWYLEGVNSSKKDEKAWRFIVEQHGPNVSGCILRVDGDTGTLTGQYRDGRFVLSHFSGARPALVIATPQVDGTLTIELKGQARVSVSTAVRPARARAEGLADPVDPRKHTSLRNPDQPFPFSFPDLNGHIVSNTDERFLNKVVLINITGSWCPNCHDEAPFLAAMYNKYHARGLEIVAVSFEEQEQLQNLSRLKAFIKAYGINYTVLIGGETASAKEKLTKASDWDSWPTTFFIGRDGLVKSVHAGFTGPASGSLYHKQTREFVNEIERLLER